MSAIRVRQRYVAAAIAEWFFFQVAQKRRVFIRMRACAMDASEAIQRVFAHARAGRTRCALAGATACLHEEMSPQRRGVLLPRPSERAFTIEMPGPRVCVSLMQQAIFKDRKSAAEMFYFAEERKIADMRLRRGARRKFR